MASSRSFNLGMTIFSLLVFTIFCLQSATVSGTAPFEYTSYYHYYDTPLNSCDRRFSNTTFLNCSKRGLSSVPHGLSPPLKKICLAYNNITTISWVDFENATSVKRLILKHNIIASINFLAFYSLRELVYLDLSYNKLTHINFYVIKNNYELKILKLTGNNFVHFDYSIRSNSLEILYLDNCNIKSISESAFYFLPNLVSLFLDNNAIYTISYNTVMPLPRLKYLSILNEDNCLPESYQELTTYLQKNTIFYMPWHMCKQEDTHDNGITTWNSGHVGKDEKIWDLKNPQEEKKRKADFHKHIASTLIITLVCVFFFGFICVIIVYECFILKKKPIDSEAQTPTAPSLAETEVHEKLPWYKQLLKLVMFKLPRDRNENAKDTTNSTSDPVQTNIDVPNSENNNRY